MTKFIITFLIFFGLTLADRHNVSIGIWDDKVGISLIGYTYNVKENDTNEYFIGGGTALLAFTGTIGWKHYHKKSKFSIYSILSEQAVAHMGFTGYMTSLSISLEYALNDWSKIKSGGFGAFLIRTDQCCNEFFKRPILFIGLEFNF